MIRRKKVESPRDLRIKNKGKEIHFFDEEYTTKRDKKTTENQDGDEWEWVNGTCRVVTSNNLHGEIILQETSTRSSRSEAWGKCTVSDSRRCANGSNRVDSRSNLDDASSKVWADEVVMKIAGWEKIPVDRIMKLVSQGDIVELTGIIHKI